MTDAAPPRQTLSYLRAMLSERGIIPKNKMGQNFLIDLNLLDLIAREAELTRDDLALEVGSGTGTLTGRLVAQAGGVVGVELDPALYPMAQDIVRDAPHATILHADALAGKNELNPRIFEAIDAVRAAAGTTRLKLVANLPYAVATPVMANLLLSAEPVSRIVATVQWEVAERLLASPGTSDYGALSILVQSLCEVQLVRKLGPTVFWPRPQVDSAIVRIDPVPERRAAVGDVVAWRAFLRDLYVHRRKNLRGALIGWPSGRREKGDVDALLAAHGFDGAGRAEQLSIADHLRLWRAFAGA